MKDRYGTYAGLIVVGLALLLWTAGCGGGGGGGGDTVSVSGGSGTTGTSGTTGGNSTTSGGSTAGNTTTAGDNDNGNDNPGGGGTTTPGGGGTNQTSTPPPPPPLAIPSGITSTSEYVPGRVLVKTRNGSNSAAIQGVGPRLQELTTAATRKGLRLKRKRRFERLRTEEVEIQSGQSVEETVDLLSQLPEVEYAEPDYILRKTEFIPNDTDFGDLWAHQNTGQDGGTVDADIDSTEAWDPNDTGSQQITGTGVVIAVIDTGVNYNHQDLDANMWVNPAEIAGDNIDNDNNGYIDDVHGINAIDGSGDPMDDNGHGTHVAGSAAAEGNNGVGVVGVAFTSKIMALKFLDQNGSGATSDAIECLEYAVEHGAHLSNASWGGAAYSSSLFNSIRDAGTENHLLVAAAGNSGWDVEQGFLRQHYPSGFSLDNIISVGASTRDEQRASFSNFGTQSVDLFAPGDDILSTVGNGYTTASGTSMAAPHVSGVAALLLSHLSTATSYTIVKARILGNVDLFQAYNGSVSGGRLNAHNALINSVTPPTPGPTTTPTPTPNSIPLSSGWNLISFPVGEVTTISIPSGVQNTFWVWNALSQSYQAISPTVSNLNSGQGTARGFWVFAQSAGTLNFTGVPSDTETLVLEEGWNLVGIPRAGIVDTSQLSVTNLDDLQTFAIADAVCDDTEPPVPCLLFQYMFFWTGNYAHVDASATSSLANGRAYWVHCWTRSELDYFPVSIER